MIYYQGLVSPLGEVFVAASPRGICRVAYGQTEAEFARWFRPEG